MSYFYTRFFEAGGETESLIDLLSDNYIGTAQSANLLANWLIVTGDHVRELTSAAGCWKKDCLLFYLLLGADVHDVEQIVEDHLKTLIVQNFDAKKADSIFTEEGGVRPQQSTKTSHTLVAQHSWNDLYFADSTMVGTNDTTSNLEIHDL